MGKTIHNLAVAACLLFTTTMIAQEKAVPCASTEYEQHLATKGLAQERADFERWLRPAVVKQQVKNNNDNEVVTLPVVVHIIHDGDEVGVSENIPDARILSQITVLNQDFRHMEGTPGHVEGNAGVDMQIEFCLAQQDPDGNPTSGIVRHNLGQASWNSMEAVDSELKAATMWDPERYLNIWVCRFGGSIAMLGGYAYFPESSGLEGLEDGESTAAIDGIVMSFKAFGSSDIFPATTYFPDNDKGRSVTHEMGHFLGLRHIWGDENSCEATDYCEDTPPVQGIHFMCEAADTCTGDEHPDMIENHMDYTPDVCKSIFTEGQKARMWAVLENSPRRVVLAQSNACQPPTAGTDENYIQGLKLYPNPAHDRLYFTSAVEGYAYEIYDVLGTRVEAGTLTAEGVINISGLSAGVYMAKITGGAKSKALRFIKD